MANYESPLNQPQNIPQGKKYRLLTMKPSCWQLASVTGKYLFHPDWKIPDYITTSLAREYETLLKGYLYVISDERGEIKFKVEFGRGQKAVNDTKKAWRKFKSLFQS